MGTTRLLLPLLLLCLTLAAVPSDAGVLSWLEGGEADHFPQADDPDDSQEDHDGGSSHQIHRLVEAMRDSFVDLATKRNSWYDRYDVLAQQTANNSHVISELNAISRLAMPIIWNSFMAESVKVRNQRLQNGDVRVYPAARTLPAPHPLRSFSTTLTEKDDFNIEVILSVERETNVGFRLMWEPESGGVFNWDEDDIFFSFHFRRYHPDSDKEVVMNDKYDGRWTPDAAITPSKHWPAIKAGQKFEIIVTKRGHCFTLMTLLGADIYVQIPKPMGYIHNFCPKPRRQAKVENEGRPLRIVVNEDNRGSGELHVHAITWYPTSEPRS